MKKLLAILIMVLLLASVIAGAETTQQEFKSPSGYPKDAIQIVIPYSPGGDTDLNARTIAKYLTELLKVNVVVTNMPGASGSIAYDYVYNAKPDGYTVLFAHNAMLITNLTGVTPNSYADYKVGGIGVEATTQVWATKADAKYKTIAEILEQLKKEPESISYATLFGNFTHLEVLAFEREAGVTFFKIDAGASSVDHLAALLGGHVEVISAPYNVVKPYVETGELIVLGNVSEERDSMIPEVPTMKEQGVNLHFSKIYPFFFPAETPDEVVDTFTKALEVVTKNPDYVKDMEAMTMRAVYYSPEVAMTKLKEVYDFFNTFDEIKP